ncbi:redoxin domain-containing protein [Dyella mobilis]|uniref:Redoxin domain-containing protein n=1 Tax=Dyella mobilis TaxID=1849582 RepID=A0ABS2KFL0_9GAMM|nr:redoxin domain-containing protein [Dyella mobilis]MBM7129951.1 redoxin domain-containing protein [Dyella mobilis]GLQ97786.1 thioredoxin [Dyella mobilis]
MKPFRIAAVLAATAAVLILFWSNVWTTAGAQEPATGAPAPDFAGATRWFNSPPLSIGNLRGKVVLVEFWTRECINCIDVQPHIKALNDQYASHGLVVVGVHTPEYDEERDPALLQKAIGEYRITWPVVMDNSYRIWNAYGNRYWPAIYLIDRQGRVVYYHVGEGNYDGIEQRVRQLLGNSQNT